MMGCTDRHCRYLLRLLSPNALLYSEMIVTGALIHGDAAHFLDHQSDEPAALQLGGSNPADLATCARLIAQAGYQEINLNVGCPSDRVQYGGIGACLMAEPDLVAGCFSAMQSAVSIPVTVKCRIGIDDSDGFNFFRDFIRPSYDAGCRVFIVHARKAMLAGLSPRDNREIPPLHYDYVHRIQDEFPAAVFILNGGLKTRTESVAELARIPGIMLGRAIYSSPWLLAELEQDIHGTPLPDRFDVIESYRQYMIMQAAQGEHIKHMAKHLLGYFRGLPGARAFRRYLSENMFHDKAGIEVLDQALSLVGTTNLRRTA